MHWSLKSFRTRMHMWITHRISHHHPQATTKFSMTTMDTLTDWRYSDERMKIREHALQVLLMKFGSELLPTGEPKYSNQKIYECAHDWVSQGNVNSNGIVKYFLAYYHEGDH